MKGVKTMSLASATSKRFQSDDIMALRINLPDGIEVSETLKIHIEEMKKLNSSVLELKKQVKDLEDKYNSLETE